MDEPSVARQLLEAAREDLKAAEALAALPHIHDSIFGFRAQQAKLDRRFAAAEVFARASARLQR